MGSAGFFFGLQKNSADHCRPHLLCKPRKRFRGLLRLLRADMSETNWTALSCNPQDTENQASFCSISLALLLVSALLSEVLTMAKLVMPLTIFKHHKIESEYIFPDTETISYLLYSECGNTGSHCTSIPNAPCCKTSKSGQFSSASLSLARSKFSKSFHSSHFSDSESLISTLKVVSHEEGLHNQLDFVWEAITWQEWTERSSTIKSFKNHWKKGGMFNSSHPSNCYSISQKSFQSRLRRDGKVLARNKYCPNPNLQTVH